MACGGSTVSMACGGCTVRVALGGVQLVHALPAVYMLAEQRLDSTSLFATIMNALCSAAYYNWFCLS